jgi:hypothetical protein
MEVYTGHYIQYDDFAVIIDMFILNTLHIMPAIISLDKSSVMETIFLPEHSAPFNGLFGQFNGIVGLEENLDCSVLMNCLRSCDEYPILQAIYTPS